MYGNVRLELIADRTQPHIKLVYTYTVDSSLTYPVRPCEKGRARAINLELMSEIAYRAYFAQVSK